MSDEALNKFEAVLRAACREKANEEWDARFPQKFLDRSPDPDWPNMLKETFIEGHAQGVADVFVIFMKMKLAEKAE